MGDLANAKSPAPGPGPKHAGTQEDSGARPPRTDPGTLTAPAGNGNASRGFGWCANPWVVAITFEVQRGTIDQVAGGA